MVLLLELINNLINLNNHNLLFLKPVLLLKKIFIKNHEKEKDKIKEKLNKLEI